MKPYFFWLILLALVISSIAPAGAEKNPVFNESLQGYRNAGDLYSYQIQNVSNQADVIYHYTVYASRMIGNNYTYNSREWQVWLKQFANPGKKYLAVWVRGWLDERSGTTWVGFRQDRFNAWIWGNTTIKPEPVRLEDIPIAYKSEKFRPAIIGEVQNRTYGRFPLTTEWYGWDLWNERIRMEPGISQAWDGFILYQVPDRAELRDIQIAGWFGYYGTAIWNLEAKEIQQDSIENRRIQDRELLEGQQKAGLRVSDRTVKNRGRA